MLRNNTQHHHSDDMRQNNAKYRKTMQNIERSSILSDNGPSNYNLYYTEKIPEYLCENCGIILGSKQTLKCHMVTKHSEKVTTYHCSKCPTICNRLDNIRRHIKKHPGQTDTPKTIMYEIKQMSPEPQRPKRQQIKKKKSPYYYQTISKQPNQHK